MISKIAASSCIVVCLSVGGIGCRHDEPPPPRVSIPSAGAPREHADRYADAQDRMKPLPPEPEASQLPPPGFDDAPLINQQPPELPAFVQAYRAVGSPRMTIFVNRTLRSEGAADDAYLRPGEYDEAQARTLDYEAIENILTDWLGADGQVTVVSPSVARQQLSEQQAREVQQGDRRGLDEAATRLGVDILVRVQAHPTKQTEHGLGIRIVAEALNTRGGESLSRAVVDVPPPLEKTTINHYTRFLGRKLMDGMTRAWTAPPPTRPERPADRTPSPSERDQPAQEGAGPKTPDAAPPPPAPAAPSAAPASQAPPASPAPNAPATPPSTQSAPLQP